MSFVARLASKSKPFLSLLVRTPRALSSRGMPSWGPPPPVIDRKDIEFRVLQSLAKHDKIDLNSISATSEFARLGLDSLDLMECVVELEDEFKLEVKDAEVDRLTSVAAVVEFVVRTLSARVDQNKRPDIEFAENMAMGRPVS